MIATATVEAPARVRLIERRELLGTLLNRRQPGHPLPIFCTGKYLSREERELVKDKVRNVMNMIRQKDRPRHTVIFGDPIPDTGAIIVGRCESGGLNFFSQ